MYVIFLVLGIVLILAAIITPLNIFMGGLAGVLFIAIGIVEMTRNKTKKKE